MSVLTILLFLQLASPDGGGSLRRTRIARISHNVDRVNERVDMESCWESRANSTLFSSRQNTTCQLFPWTARKIADQ
jgi:hypothetical protein